MEIVWFEPAPGDVRWGITFSWGPGVDFVFYVNENFTTSTESWHIWDLIT